MTRVSQVLNKSGSKIVIYPSNGIRHSIIIIYDGLHSYISTKKCKLLVSPLFVLTGHKSSININSNILKSWSQNKRILYKVHLHTCGHSTFSDIRTLFERNLIWSEDVEKYCGDVIRNFTSIILSSTSPPCGTWLGK